MPNDIQSLSLAVLACEEPMENAARTVQYSDYIHEIFAHAGVAYTKLNEAMLLDALGSMSVLVTVGEGVFPEATSTALLAWVQTGGAWIALGGVCGLGEALGLDPEAPAYAGFGAGISTLGEGYLEVKEQDHPILEHINIPLHFFNGIPMRLREGTLLAGVLDAHQGKTERAGISEHIVGKGRVIVFAVDITGTIVRIQQGLAVTRDGVSAPDGTAPICDDVLKSSDGFVLDWIFDRQPIPEEPTLPAFLEPIADQWREAVLRAVFYCARELDLPLPVLWLYPRNLPALAHMSHDTDGSDPVLAQLLIDTLLEAEIESTWCVICPPYEAEIIDAIEAAGGELGMHYDAMSPDTVWGEADFEEQFQTLTDTFNGKQIRSNKNHYLRWEGDTELFEWCVKRGIQLDESKGPAKSGEAGFNFGTCHPYFPITFKGEMLDVIELSTHTQDLIVFAPECLRPPMQEAVLKHHGILHLLFHPGHIDKPGMVDCVLESVRDAKEAGMEWWTASQINHWERARRKVSWAISEDDAVTLTMPEALPEATLLVLGKLDPDVEGASAVELVQRWGFEFTAITLSDTAHETLALKIQQ